MNPLKIKFCLTTTEVFSSAVRMQTSYVIDLVSDKLSLVIPFITNSFNKLKVYCKKCNLQSTFLAQIRVFVLRFQLGINSITSQFNLSKFCACVGQPWLVLLFNTYVGLCLGFPFSFSIQNSHTFAFAIVVVVAAVCCLPVQLPLLFSFPLYIKTTSMSDSPGAAFSRSSLHFIKFEKADVRSGLVLCIVVVVVAVVAASAFCVY